ncbi:thioredoxin family protein [Muricoccus radiodurans]|uniref:thioredoxin family protein n=1 Tax=Muricoccus radiodurans TaxID=2231721 RepID=UPI003CF34818
MAGTAVPDFFFRFPMRPIRATTLDGALAEPDAPPLVMLFLWGMNCPNCDVAKRAILLAPDRFRWPELRWMHTNVYDDADMATRFGLHGVPAFFLFRGSRRIGRITGWPGSDEFCAAVEREIARGAAAPA